MRQNTKRIPAKGTSRRVVIVRGDHDSVFEQIIYIVRDDCFAGDGVSADDVLREAVQALHIENTDENEEVSSLLFSRVLMFLVFIAILLTIGILLYLHYYGWS